MSAATLLVEIGDDMGHFGSPDRLAAWAARCPGNNESAGKRKSGRSRKGNTLLRSLLCEVANAARRTLSVFRAKYKGLLVRRGHKHPLSLWPINSSAPFTSCSHPASRIAIRALILEKAVSREKRKGKSKACKSQTFTQRVRCQNMLST